MGRWMLFKTAESRSGSLGNPNPNGGLIELVISAMLSNLGCKTWSNDTSFFFKLSEDEFHRCPVVVLKQLQPFTPTLNDCG